MNEHIVAIFENDPENPLPCLKREMRDMDNSMKDLRKKLRETGEGELTWDPYRNGVEPGGLADMLQRDMETISIFHFSGHAGRGFMQMEDGKMVNTDALIRFFDMCPKLKVVFINGCNSRDFVDDLSNVPIVIATNRPIVDAYAYQVSSRFYAQIKENPARFNRPEEINKLFDEARTLVNIQDIDADCGDENTAESATDRGGLGRDGDQVSGATDDPYIFRINISAPRYKVVFPETDVNKQLWQHIQPIEKQINHPDIKKGQLYKTYPYLFSRLLMPVMPQVIDKGGVVRLKKEGLGDLAQLSLDRCLAIFDLHYQLCTFLKFCAFSILWTLHNRKLQNLKELSQELKDLLKGQLSHHYYGTANVGSEKITALEKTYTAIPFDAIKNSDAIQENESTVWIKLHELVLNEAEGLKRMAELVHSFESEDALDDEANWSEAETFLIDFVTKDSYAFLRELSIWSIYDISYRQFRYRDEKELVFRRGLYPVKQRPSAGISDQDTMTLSPDDPIDYDVQSVYLVKNDVRVLNLTPFYVDMYAADENANKMDICYLEAYRDKMDLNYISLLDNKEWHKVGESKENDEQMFVYDQVKHFWTLISSTSHA